MEETTVNSLITIPCVVGCLISIKQWIAVSKVKIDGHPGLKDPLLANQGDAEKAEIAKQMLTISTTIADGAMSFLKAEYSYMGVYVVLFSGILYWFTGWETTVSFVFGAITSIICGLIGMKIAVYTNVRTAHECWAELRRGFDVAIQGGCVMGLSLVSIGIINLFILIQFLLKYSSLRDQKLYEAVAGYGLGGSSIALFGRVGGGIYTKAADVGADLSGKNDYGMDEDDYRNPACIADNVGDNVGDIAGMGADLFGSFAESTCAALVLASSSIDLKEHGWCAIMYPVLISSLGVVVGIVTLLVSGIVYPINNQDPNTVEKALKGILNISTALMTPVVFYLSKVCLPETFKMDKEGPEVQWWYCCLSISLGLWSGLLIGYVTEYYTSASYTPVREIAETQKQSAATGIIYGLALGYLSCIIPVLALGITILVAHSLCGMFGIALSALGMLGTMTMALTIDAYGPISDNAGGIAEMSGLPEQVRERTDCLDAAGNTTAAIGKGFAIGSAALVSLALFGAFTVRAEIHDVDILDPWVFTGLLFGAMMPYAFAAWTMKSVGEAANDMVKECLGQFPGIMAGTQKPDYHRCIQISTDASLREMIKPGLLVIASPLVAGLGFGKNACAGLLSGALVSSVQLAISMSNSGGAWDNAKKYISAGGLGPQFVKGSEAHKNSVTGDTVGDPLKDTSGPALNIVMKLTAIISLVFGSAILKYSNAQGGPIWMS
jgi:inorganic pyrophosphatase